MLMAGAVVLQVLIFALMALARVRVLAAVLSVTRMGCASTVRVVHARIVMMVIARVVTCLLHAMVVFVRSVV
jgi:hypothetical protein